MRARYGFLIALVLTVLAARLAAAAGLGFVPGLPAAGWLRTACIVGIFLIGGLTLRTDELGRAAAHWRLHALTQGISLGLIPLLFVVLDGPLAAAGLAPSLRDGLIVLACVPTTVTSCVVYTRLAGGNEAAALFNATLGNLLGIVVTPQLLLMLLGRTASVDAVGIIAKLSLMVLLPVLVGQALRGPLSGLIDRHKIALKRSSNGLLLTILWLVFVATFSRPLPVGGGALLGVALWVVGMRVLLLAAAWVISALPGLGFDRGDRIAVAIAGTQKTVVLGLPLIGLLFANDPAAGLLSLPLLIYHPTQLVLDGLLAPMWARGALDAPGTSARAADANQDKNETTA
jgi:sodium/bile acid cotransporter 7